MSQFYDLASLVVIPSGYKASTIYAQKPLTTDGQLSFTRASGATRVASNGLIEKVRTNLCLQSNTFSNAAWNKIAQGTGTTPVVTANYTTDPFGGNNGWRLQCNLGGGTTTSDRSWLQQDIAGTTVPTTVSVYAKLNSAGSATFALTNASTDNVTITSTDWVRISTVRTAATTVYSFRIGLIGGVGQSGTLDISIAFAQLETGDIATNYIPTTSAAVSVGPVSNVPRLDYTNSSCPRLLLEPQRTNLMPYSEQINTTNYSSSTQVNVTENALVSPDGYTNADLVVPNTTNANHGIGRNISGLTSGATYMCSVFAKAQGYSKFLILAGAGTGSGSYEFNLATGTAAAGATITDYGNGWYRCSAPLVPNSGLLQFLTFISNGSSYSYAGNGTSGIAMYGVQVELGSYATSYIPTLSTSVTRLADAASKTGISSLIGQTEGTIFVEFQTLQLNPTNVSRIILSDGTTSNYIFLGLNEAGSGNLSRLYVNNTGAGTSVSVFSSTALTVGTNKLAMAYKSGSFALYLNGNLVGSSASAVTIPATSQLVVGGQSPSATTQLETMVNKQLILFKTRLTNAQLAELTTL